MTIKIPHCIGGIIKESLTLSQPGDVLVIDSSGDVDVDVDVDGVFILEAAQTKELINQLIEKQHADQRHRNFYKTRKTVSINTSLR